MLILKNFYKIHLCKEFNTNFIETNHSYCFKHFSQRHLFTYFNQIILSKKVNRSQG